MALSYCLHVPITSGRRVLAKSAGREELRNNDSEVHPHKTCSAPRVWCVNAAVGSVVSGWMFFAAFTSTTEVSLRSAMCNRLQQHRCHRLGLSIILGESYRRLAVMALRRYITPLLQQDAYVFPLFGVAVVIGVRIHSVQSRYISCSVRPAIIV